MINSVKTEWLREETAFMAVDSTALAAAAFFTRASASVAHPIGSRVDPCPTVCPPVIGSSCCKMILGQQQQDLLDHKCSSSSASQAVGSLRLASGSARCLEQHLNKHLAFESAL